MQVAKLVKLREKCEENTSLKIQEETIDILNIEENTFRNKLLINNDNRKKVLREIYSTLAQFKLTKNEIKIYFYLIQHGAHKAQQISESLLLPRTETYKILKDLEYKGVVFRVLERPMKFAAIPFEKMFNMEIEKKKQKIKQLEKKKRDIIDIWKLVPKIEKEEYKETMQILGGKRQIDARIADILRKTTTQLNVVISDEDFSMFYNSSFFEELEKISKNSRIEIKIITEYKENSTFTLDQIELKNYDFIFTHLGKQPSYILSDSESVIIFMNKSEGKMSIMETNYNAILKSYIYLFELLWKNK